MKTSGIVGRRLEKLDALTSLRFFAAAMIVVYHSQAYIGEIKIFGYSPLVQGVSFFFVLSGFVLAYAYPELPSRGHVYRFLWARFARIWPLHMATLLLVLLLVATLPGSHPFLYSIANIFMFHAWIPVQESYFSFNSVSWSISTEFFFYLCFPILIYKWSSTWHIKLAIVLLIWLMNIVTVNTLGLNPDGMVYIHPISRLLEFTIGIVTCAMFKLILTHDRRISVAQGTFLEFSVLIMLAVLIFSISILLNNQHFNQVMGVAGRYWISSSGACLLFALLILVMSFQAGLISKLLQGKVFVFLGEISFAVYMTHQIIIRFYTASINELDIFSPWGAVTFCWGLTLLLSAIFYLYVEKPGRIALIKFYQNMEARKCSSDVNVADKKYFSSAQKNILKHSRMSLKWMLLVLSVVMLMVGSALWLIDSEKTKKVQEDITFQMFGGETNLMLTPVVFNGLVELHALQIEQLSGGRYKFSLKWACEQGVNLKYKVALHYLNGRGDTVGMSSYDVDIRQHTTEASDFWSDSVITPADQLSGAEKVAVVLFEDATRMEGIYLVDGGQTDWGKHRLIVPLMKQ